MFILPWPFPRKTVWYIIRFLFFFFLAISDWCFMGMLLTWWNQLFSHVSFFSGDISSLKKLMRMNWHFVSAPGPMGASGKPGWVLMYAHQGLLVDFGPWYLGCCSRYLLLFKWNVTPNNCLNFLLFFPVFTFSYDYLAMPSPHR